MGNCLVIQQDRKEIKIMRVAGSKVLKMPSSAPATLTVKQEALAAEPLDAGHIIPDDDGVLDLPAKAAVTDPGAVRVKLVISKQELKRMLDKEGMSLDDMVAAMRKQAVFDDRESCGGGWRPALESIPEGSGF